VLRRRGAAGFTRACLARAGKRVFLREEHVWLELRLTEAPAAPPLDDSLRLVVASGAQLDLVAELGHSPSQARRFTACGNEQWLVLAGDRPVCGCRVFRAETPVLAARGGWLPLPDRTACMEDLVTSAAFRHRRIALRACGAIVDRLRAEGLERILVKIETANEASRSGAAKLGFEDVAVMRLCRVGPHTRVRVDVLGDAPAGVELARLLARPARRRSSAAALLRRAYTQPRAPSRR
jgi:ribosomal protein S18 acetylase RimI-like enzyme